MLKIGDFSKLARVSVKTLRYYAEIGLLAPAWVDRFTGYRYYGLEQLPRLNRILALKDLGFSLQQIARIMDDSLSVEQLRGMVRMKQAEIQRQIEAEQMRLAQVEARLKLIEEEGRLPNYEVVLKKIPQQFIATTRSTASSIQTLLDQRREMAAEVARWLQTNRADPCGPWMTIYYNTEYTERNIEVEVAVPIACGIGLAYAGRVGVRLLQGVEMAACVTPAGLDPGAYRADLDGAYTAFYQWMEHTHHRLSGPVRELTLGEGGEDPVFDGMMEMQFPVEAIMAVSLNQETKMEPKIVTSPAFMVAGAKYHGKNDNNEIPMVWENEFLPRLHEIKRANPNVTFGVCDAEMEPDGSFTYVAGAEVSSPADVPEGMVLYRVPEHRYAVFAHKGNQAGLRNTYDYIYQVWLPQSPYKRAATPDFEMYNEDFNDFQEDSVLYLYVPIEEK